MMMTQIKVSWTGTVVSIQPRSTVWRYITDNRTHRECGFNVFLKGSVVLTSPPEPGDSIWDVTSYCESHRANDIYSFCVAISDKQAQKLLISIGDELKGTAWTPLYPETEFASFYRAGGLKKIRAVVSPIPLAILDTEHTTFDGAAISRVDSSKYPGPPWKMVPPPLEIYAWRGARMLSKSCWSHKCFQCVWANMANVTVQYDFDRNLVRNRFETFCYGPLNCKYYKMGPARSVPYKGMSGIKDQGWLDEICVQYRLNEEE